MNLSESLSIALNAMNDNFSNYKIALKDPGCTESQQLNLKDTIESIEDAYDVISTFQSKLNRLKVARKNFEDLSNDINESIKNLD